MMDNPFANWDPNQEQTQKTEKKTKRQLEDIYFKSRNKKSQLQQIQSFNTKFEQFTLETGQNSIQFTNNKDNNQAAFHHFENKNLLNQTQVSVKSLGKLQTFGAAGVHLLIILTLLQSQSILFIKVIGLVLQILLTVLFGLHLQLKDKLFEKIKRSKFILVQMTSIIISGLFAFWICLGNSILTVLICFFSVYDFLRVKKLKILYVSQQILQSKPPIINLEIQQFEDFD